ncbi:MAG: tRNA isopentenyl-2-thiomethyl-A-37 hydroxylase MiaE [Planctomycetota bacterium]
MSELGWTTPAAWASDALAAPEALLDDRAHCELGAAAAAQSLLMRNPKRLPVDRLAALVIEELQHFREVHALLLRRGGRLSHPRKNPYVDGLRAWIRRGSDMVLLDTLLVAGVIERRSLERFELLAEHAVDAELAALYRELGPSERGHALLFDRLALELFGTPAATRAEELTAHEADVARSAPPGARIHAGPPGVQSEPARAEG